MKKAGIESLIIFGAPGCGKRTFVKRAIGKARIHIESGPLIKKAQLQMDQVKTGRLASDDVVMPLVWGKVLSFGLNSPFVFDGVPRSLEQARQLLFILTEHNHKVKTIFVKIEKERALQRIAKRYMEEGREDDAPEIARNRLEEYEGYGPPTINYLANHTEFIEVDNNHSMDSELARLMELVGLPEVNTESNSVKCADYHSAAFAN